MEWIFRMLSLVVNTQTIRVVSDSAVVQRDRRLRFTSNIIKFNIDDGAFTILVTNKTHQQLAMKTAATRQV